MMKEQFFCYIKARTSYISIR